ncbi:MAG: WecB/TagA/CpsF family glycosyltransferase [Solirubrobacterales bacterium]
MRSRVNILGVEVDAVSVDDVWPQVQSWLAAGRREYVCVTGVHGVTECQRDSELLHIHNRSGLTVPDGMPLVWCGRYAGASGIDRVYGPQMMLEVCRRASEAGVKSFFYGGKEGVPELLAKRLREMIPGLQVVGCHSPPFGPIGPGEEQEAIEMIEASGAELIWVGLSTPKQERRMAELRQKLSGPRVLFGVGAAFDINAGLVPDAPVWLGRLGLHWLFRLVLEPRRLWRRYLRANPAFVVKILRNPPELMSDDPVPPE